MAKKRKKLPKEVAIINADNCTGCEACLEVCPVFSPGAKSMSNAVSAAKSVFTFLARNRIPTSC